MIPRNTVSAIPSAMSSAPIAPPGTNQREVQFNIPTTILANIFGGNGWQWNIPANIEYAYKGADTVAEVKKCYAYCKSVLQA